MSTTDRQRGPGTKWWLIIGGAILGAGFLLFWGLGPMPSGNSGPPTPGMMQVREIGMALEHYASSHGGQYPPGKTSTEVFNNLLDTGYVGDPGMFYLPRPGKVQAVTGQKLKSENVCFDVTVGAGANPPKWLPLVFTTGFRVNYAPGGSAVPLKPLTASDRFWLAHSPSRWTRANRGIAVWYAGPFRADYLGGTATFIPAGMEIREGTDSWIFMDNEGDANDGSLRHFIPKVFQPDSRHYRQLAPDGALE